MYENLSPNVREFIPQKITRKIDFLLKRDNYVKKQPKKSDGALFPA